jgi:hypothetical protein
MRPLATIFSRVGMDTVSTRPIVRVTFWIHMSCMGSETGTPCTPMGDGAARADQGRGGQQRLGVADGLDRDVDAHAAGQLQDVGGGVVPGFHGVGGAELQGLSSRNFFESTAMTREAPQACGQDAGQRLRPAALQRRHR